MASTLILCVLAAASAVASLASVETCSRSYSEPEGIISSPNYPEGYPHGAYCEYDIEVQGAAGIEINLLSFQLESGSRGVCIFDSLTIYSYLNGIPHQQQKLCGRLNPQFQNNIILGHKVLLRFTSDSSVAGSGFSLTYRALNEVTREMTMRCEVGWTRFKNDCHKYFSSRTGYPYAALNCRAENAHVLIPRSEEENEYFQGKMTRWNSMMWLGVSDVITEGVWTDDGGNSINWANWSESEPNNRWGSEDCVQMNRYGEWNDISCRMRQLPYFCVKSIDNNTDSTLPLLPFPEGSNNGSSFLSNNDNISTSCSANYYVSQGNISSPNYPERYPHGAYCEYDIEVQGAAGIEINMLSFQLESCPFDSLTVYSFLNGIPHQEQKLCGRLSPQFQNNIILGHKVLLLFRSDGSTAYSGFSLTYRALEEVPREMTMIQF